MPGFWASETSEPPNEGRTTTPTLPPPGPFRSPAIGGPDVVDTFTAAVNRWGTPASLLTDNGAIFTATPRLRANQSGTVMSSWKQADAAVAHAAPCLFSLSNQVGGPIRT